MSRTTPSAAAVIAVPSYALCSDEDLLSSAREGDQDAAGEIVRRYRDPALGVVRLVHPNDQEDVLQEGCILFLRRLDLCDASKGGVKGWFLWNVHLAALEWARQAQARREHADLDLYFIADADPSSNPAYRMDRTAIYLLIAEAFRSARARLTDLQNKILTLFLAGVSNADVARQLGISVVYARVLRHRTLTEFKHHFKTNERLREAWNELISNSDEERALNVLVRILTESLSTGEPKTSCVNLNSTVSVDQHAQDISQHRASRFIRELFADSRNDERNTDETLRDLLRDVFCSTNADVSTFCPKNADEMLSDEMIARIVSRAFARLAAEGHRGTSHRVPRHMSKQTASRQHPRSSQFQPFSFDPS